MNKFIITAVCCLLAAAVPGRAADYLAIQPAITFYEDGSTPVATGAVQVGGTFSIRYIGTSSKAVDTAYVRQDTLVIATYPDTLIYFAATGVSIMPPYFSGPEVTFMQAGGLTVCELPRGGVLAPVATLRVLPLLETVPVMPVTGTPVHIELALGLSHSSCNPAYDNTLATATDSSIALSWTEVPFMAACLGIYLDPPVSYGPQFDAGTLAAGTYTVFIDDTVAVGTIVVDDPVTVTGAAFKMKNPDTDDMSVPVESVKVVAETYYPCSWGFATGYAGPVCSTYTDASGAFSLNLPRADLDYNLVATVSGYHLQTRAVDEPVSAVLEYRLLPDTDTAAVPVTVTVRDGNGAPLESVYVSITGGRAQVFCPVFLGKTTAANYSSMSDAAGHAAFDDVSLSPFIDYVYSANRYGTNPLSKTGSFRLYRADGYNNDIIIEIPMSGIGGSAVSGAERLYLDIPENPVAGNGFTVRYPAGIAPAFVLYSPSGIPAGTAERVRPGESRISVTGLSKGVYLLHAHDGLRSTVAKVIIR